MVLLRMWGRNFMVLLYILSVWLIWLWGIFRCGVWVLEGSYIGCFMFINWVMKVCEVSGCIGVDIFYKGSSSCGGCCRVV